MELNKLFIVLSIWILTLFGCQKSSRTSSNTYPEVINGTWFVYYGFGQNKELVGILTVHADKKYQFNLQTTNQANLQLIIARLPFLNYVKGDNELHVYDVQELKNRESTSNPTVIAHCYFGSYEENFEIRVNDKEDILFFHARISELQLWAIEKPLK